MIDNYLKEELLQKVTSLPRLVIVLREDDCCVKYCETLHLRSRLGAGGETKNPTRALIEHFQTKKRKNIGFGFSAKNYVPFSR